MVTLIVVSAILSVLETLTFSSLIQPGEIFGFYGKWLSNIRNEKLRKPLGACPFCFNFYALLATYILLAIYLNVGFSIYVVLGFIVSYCISHTILKINYNIYSYFFYRDDELE